MECAHEGCTGSAKKSGYCERHYRQRRIRGEVGWDGTVCLEEGCTDPAVSKGRCHKHYGIFHRKEVAARGSCSIEGCEAPLYSGGWCQRHYARNQRWGDPLAWKKPVRQPCSFEGCERKQAADGFCDMHYRRVGTPEFPQPPVHVDPPPLICPQCGGAVPPRTGRGKQRTYCSDECRDAANYWKKQEHKLRNQLRPYGLTPEQFYQLVADQDGRCAICWSDEPGGRGAWHIDHCHDTGRVRGLLCADCNIGLGKFKDDTDALRRAVAYLEGAARTVHRHFDG